MAMAAVGDLVAPRERGRYQGYIAATFAVATIVGPLIGGVLVDHASWRWVFLVNLPIGVAALAGLHLRLPAPDVAGLRSAARRIGCRPCWPGATSALMLTCIWGGSRYAWDSGQILALIAATVVLSAALLARERRAADPIVPFHLLRTGPVAIASAALFLGTAALFSVTVFVPLFLETTTGASPTEAGLLLVPAMLGITVSTTLSGRSDRAHGALQALPDRRPGAHDGGARPARRLRRRPLAGRHRARARRVRPGLRHGHAGPDRRRPEQRRPARARRRDRHDGFFRALGGAVGAAVLGAVFAAQAAPTEGVARALRADVIDGVQAVFLVAAPLAALALLVVLRLPELPLQTANRKS